MREQLIQYVNLLFAGSSGTEDIKQEILQNTLDRYDDLLAQGLTPESAYRQAIEGVGDVGEIIDDPAHSAYPSDPLSGSNSGTSAGVKAARTVKVYRKEKQQTSHPAVDSPDGSNTSGNPDSSSSSESPKGSDNSNGSDNSISFTFSIPQMPDFSQSSFKPTGHSDGEQGTASAQSYTFCAETVDILDIEWIAGDVNIEAGEREAITVSEDLNGSQYPMVVRQEGGKLSVKFSESKRNLFINRVKDLYVTVPADWNGHKLKVESASGDISCSGIALKEAELETASGDCKLEGCSIEILRVDSASGDVSCTGDVDTLDVDIASGDVKFNGSLQTVKLDSASGDAEIVVRNIPKLLSFDTVSGDVNLTLPENCGFTLTRSSMGGDFHSDFAITGDGKRAVCGNGACQIKASSVSSDICIRKAPCVN